MRRRFDVKPRWGLYVGVFSFPGCALRQAQGDPGHWSSTPSALVIASTLYLRRAHCQFHTPKALHSIAQGRAAHPGLAAHNIPRTPTGFHMVGCALRFRCETPLEWRWFRAGMGGAVEREREQEQEQKSGADPWATPFIP